VGTDAHVVVVGNEKGGSGKTTLALHVAVGLLRLGFRVGCLDLDAHQASLTRILASRRACGERLAAALPQPRLEAVAPSTLDSRAAALEEERARLDLAVAGLAAACDFVVIDCPGADAPLSRLAHLHADTLLTPINDSPLDLDLIGRVDPLRRALVAPGPYAERVWEWRRERCRRHRAGLDWLVVRSRFRNDGGNALAADLVGPMAQVLGFRLITGLAERRAHRDLLLWGLTALDLDQPGLDFERTEAHRAAQAEARALLAELWLPRVADRLRGA
jgi:chromosome partitioning protein